MAKIKPVEEALSKQDRDNYIKGFNSDKRDKNPYDESDLRNYQAWSAGHFDKHGRV